MTNERLWQELQGIKRILTLRYSDDIESYMNAVITTATRRKIWVNIDGMKTVSEIANDVDVSDQAVTGFLRVVRAANLVEWQPREIPRRLIEHIPAEWLEEIS